MYVQTLTVYGDILRRHQRRIVLWLYLKNEDRDQREGRVALMILFMSQMLSVVLAVTSLYCRIMYVLSVARTGAGQS